eukprot:8702617-Lingulodinium_polyedra.AAC.1
MASSWPAHGQPMANAGPTHGQFMSNSHNWRPRASSRPKHLVAFPDGVRDDEEGAEDPLEDQL